MSLFKKLLLGTAIASAMLFTLPSEQAQAASATLTKEFYYQLNTMDKWEYKPIGHDDPYLLSVTNSSNRAVSYVQFLVDPAVANAEGSLSMMLHDVSTDPDTTAGALQIWRVDDQAVYDAALGFIDHVSDAPIALGTLLATTPVRDADDNKSLVFDFTSLISSAQLVNSNSYLSFAIVATRDTASWIKTEQDPNTVNLTVETPAPEPMSAAYILVGAGAFALRRARKLLGIA